MQTNENQRSGHCLNVWLFAHNLEHQKIMGPPKSPLPFLMANVPELNTISDVTCTRNRSPHLLQSGPFKLHPDPFFKEIAYLKRESLNSHSGTPYTQ
jgi:hypothetical protein